MHSDMCLSFSQSNIPRPS